MNKEVRQLIETQLPLILKGFNIDFSKLSIFEDKPNKELLILIPHTEIIYTSLIDALDNLVYTIRMYTNFEIIQFLIRPLVSIDSIELQEKLDNYLRDTEYEAIALPDNYVIVQKDMDENTYLRIFEVDIDEDDEDDYISITVSKSIFNQLKKYLQKINNQLRPE